MEKKKLTISMLVSGREETTEKSLQSLELLKKELDTEVILVNTGCGEALLEKIKSYADTIIPFSWCNDFAKARNVGLEVAKGEWFLYLDDDEWFEDVTPIVAFFQSGEYKEYHQAAYLVRNYKDMQGTAYTDTWVSRMIRREEDTHFEGRVHESLVPTRGKCKKIHAFVHHYGYVYANEEERQKHMERNIAILEPLVEEEPNNLRWRLQLIQEYATMQMWEKLRENAKKGIALTESSETPFHNLCRGSFYMAVLLVDKSEKKWNALWEDYQIFIEDRRNLQNVKCALSGMVASGIAELWKKGKKDEILEFYFKVKEEETSEIIRNQKRNAFVFENETLSETKLENVVSENLSEAKSKNVVCENRNILELNENLLSENRSILELITDYVSQYFQYLEKYQAEEKDEQWQIIEESAVLVSEYTTKQMQLQMCYLWAECIAELLLMEEIETVDNEQIQCGLNMQINMIQVDNEAKNTEIKEIETAATSEKIECNIEIKNKKVIQDKMKDEFQEKNIQVSANFENFEENDDQNNKKQNWICKNLNNFDKCQHLLIEDMQKKLHQNGEFLMITEDIWKIAKAGLLPLEELLLSLSISQWMAQMMVLESKGYGSDWDKIGQHLEELCSVDDIRYAFFDWKTEVAKMKQIYAQKENVEKMDYQTITQVLYDFAFANLHYAEFVYTDNAFLGEMEFLPEEIRAAFWLSESFACEETNWSRKLECIKNATKEWKVLSEMIKHYAVLIGEEQEQAQRASQNAKNELLQMANSMKPQIFVMVEKGMLKEAFDIVKQLRGLVPEDRELIEMENVLLEAMI